MFLAGMYMKVSSPHTTLSMKAANSQQKFVASLHFPDNLPAESNTSVSI